MNLTDPSGLAGGCETCYNDLRLGMSHEQALLAQQGWEPYSEALFKGTAIGFGIAGLVYAPQIAIAAGANPGVVTLGVVTAELTALGASGGVEPTATRITKIDSGLIYRSASGTPNSMTPRPVDTSGLSAANSLENALPGKNQIIDTAKLTNLCAVCDNSATGHVSIAPIDMNRMGGVDS